MNTIAQSTFNPSIAVINGTIKTTSLKVAEHFGKQHKHVLRKIQTLDCSLNFTESNFGLSEYIDESGKSNPYYEMTKDGFVFLAMGFTGKQAAQWKEAYINAFNAMADKLNSNTSQYITEFEAYQFNKSVKAHCKSDRYLYSDTYNMIYEYYGITSYKNIPAGCLKEAAELICGIRLITGNPPKPINPRLTIEDVMDCINKNIEPITEKKMKALRAELRHEVLQKIADDWKAHNLTCQFLISVDASNITSITPV
jgi:Rha family phage regulatory protein